MRRIGLLFGVSIGPLLALAPVRDRRIGAVAIVDGTPVRALAHRLAAPSKDYRYSTSVHVAIDAGTRLVIAAGDPEPGSHNGCTVCRDSRIAGQLAGRPVRAEGGCQKSPDVVMPCRKPRDGGEVPGWKQHLNATRGKVRARVEHGSVPDEERHDPSRLSPRREHTRRHGVRNRAPAQTSSSPADRIPSPINRNTNYETVSGAGSSEIDYSPLCRSCAEPP
jgi:hypothetical protein